MVAQTSHSLTSAATRRPLAMLATGLSSFLLAPLLAPLLVLGPADVVHAERTDRDKPVNFFADKSEAINYDTKVATLVGNVIITQGTLRLQASRIVFRQNPDNTLSATAYGSPVSFRQKRDGSDEYIEGFAQRAEYDGQKEVLQLFDQALLKQSTDEIRSNYIYYNASTETFRAGPDSNSASNVSTDTPSSHGERGVSGTFQPKDMNSKGKPEHSRPSATLKSEQKLEAR